MIDLPPKFKQALGNGVRTSLYPLIKIYKGYRIDDTIPDDAESINLSIKETNVSGSAYKPLLLNLPSINSSADIINNKYTISSVSLSISNAPFQGKIFSDDIQSLLNAVVQVYYCANGIDSIDDCLLVYTGTIRRFSQSTETIKLELEDATQQILSTKIPSTLIPDDVTYKEEDIGKPYPMVYGYVDKSPLILKASPDPETGAVYEIMSNLIIDKPNQKIAGTWNLSLSELYENDKIEDTLLTPNLITDENYLFVYNDGFLPINRIMPDGWAFNYNSEDGPSTYETSTLDGKILYNIDNDVSYGPNIKLSAEAQTIMTQIEQFTDTGIPTRIYRPIIKTGFFAKNSNNTTWEHNGYGIDNENKIYGFNNLDTSLWDPRKEVVKSKDVFLGNFVGPNINDDSPAKNEYSRDWGLDNPMWWEPTTINELVPPYGGNLVQWSYKDINWENNKGNGEFPVSYIQNGDLNSGIHLTSQTYQTHSSPPNSGCFVKLMLNKAPSFNCVTKIYYTVTYYQPQNIGANAQFRAAQMNHMMQPTSLWMNPILESLNPVTPPFFENLNHILSNSNQGDIPFYTDEAEAIQDYDGVSIGVNSRSVQVTGNQISTLFNDTNASHSIQWGIRDIRGGSFHGFSVQSCVANLQEFYTIQDVLVNDIINRDYFASVAGRLDVNDNEITKSSKIIEDILNNEFNSDIEIEDTNIDDGWEHSFVLNEQKEAKEIFEGVAKSSLFIPSFNASGQFTFIPVHQILNDVSYTTIDNQNILKYSFSLTKLDDIKNSVNVKYKKNYGSGEFDKETGYKLIDANNNEFDNYDAVTQSIFNDTTKHYNIDYYGLTSEEAKLEVETNYIRDDETARKLQKKLVSWYANQHLIIKIDLSINYINLETGDYIHFNELVGGKLAFGYDYTKTDFKNGQIVYPIFFITKINKSLNKVTIEAIQVHRGEYGQDDEEIFLDEETETVVDGGGTSGQGNWELPDSNNNSNYSDETIVDEEVVVEEYLNCSWYQGNNNLDNAPQILLDTNIEGEFNCDVVITYNDEEIVHPETGAVLIPVIQDNEHNASDYINVSKTEYTNAEGNIQGGSVMLSTPYLIPEEHNGIVGLVRVYYQGTTYSVELNFAQNYVYVPPPILGDINGDGIVNILDVVMMGLAIQGGTQTQTDFLADNPQGDINGDGILSILDIILLINMIQEQ